MAATTVTSVVAATRPNRYHLLVLSLCGALMVMDGYDMVSFGTVVAGLIKDWHISTVTAGTLGSMALIGMLVGGTLIAPLADRIGRRPVIIACVVVTSISSFACAFATGPASLGAIRIVVGVSLGALVPNFVAMTAEFAPQGHKAQFVTLVSSVYSVGGILAALLAIRIMPHWGWHGVFYGSGWSILLVPVMLRYLPESPEFLAARGQHRRLLAVLRKLNPTADLHAVAATPRSAAPKAPVVQLFAHGNAIKSLLIWIFFAMCMLLSYGLNTWLPKLMQSAGYAMSSALWTLVVLNLGGLVGAIVGGFVADRWTYRGTLTVYYLVASTALIALSFHPDAWLLNVLLFLAGAATVGVLAIIHAFAVEYYPIGVRSTGVGWAAGMGRLGAIAGPTLGGALLDLDLPFRQNFIAFAVPGVIGAVAVAIVARTTFGTAATCSEQPAPVHAS